MNDHLGAPSPFRTSELKTSSNTQKQEQNVEGEKMVSLPILNCKNMGQSKIKASNWKMLFSVIFYFCNLHCEGIGFNISFQEMDWVKQCF